jgi:hypothetical protein
MLQNKTPFMAWVVGDPHFGTFTWSSGLFQSPRADRPHPVWQDATFVCRTHELLLVSQGTGFMFGFPGPVPGDGLH